MIGKNTISILGCGWAGYPLAKALVEKGYYIKGSTTSSDKLSLMGKDGIDPFLVQLSPDVNTEREGFFNSDLLVITIPPKKDPDHYILQIRSILLHIHRYHIKRVIYFSSTSVYGSPNKIVNENDPLIPDTASANVIRSVEELLLNDPSFKTTIIRFGGLVGPNRHPGRFLAGKKDIANGMAPVNLIHLNDCIGLISSIIENNFFGIINACSPDHPTRKDYYVLAAQTAGLSEPQFIEELKEWKIVDSIHRKLLNYEFQIKNWASWLLSGEEN